MSSNAVEVVVEPVGRRGSDGREVGPGTGVDEFFLEGGESALRDGVVVADSCSPQGATDLVSGTVVRELLGRILCSAVAVKPISA